MEKFVTGKEYRWIWFLTTILLGASPLVVTFFVNMAKRTLQWNDIETYYKLEDLLFWGIAMLLSNLNMVGSRKTEAYKVFLITLSGVGVFFMAIFLGIIQMASDIDSVFKVVIHFSVAASIYVSSCANNYVYKKVIK